MGCGTIRTGSTLDCRTPLAGGIGGDSRLVLYNLSEVSFTESAATPGLITAITMASGASGYAFQGYKTSLKPSVDTALAGLGQTQYKHRTQFMVFENSQLAKNNIQNLANGRYVAIIENNGKNSNSFEIYGLTIGLEIKPQKIRDLGENGAAYLLLLETPETDLEPLLPQTFFITSYTASLTALNVTLFLPTVTNLSNLALSASGGGSETVTGTNFYGSGAVASEVLSVGWVNQITGAVVAQTTYTVASATSITMASAVVAMPAGSYRLRVTTTKGIADSTQVAIVT